jgi:peroxiredoxin
MLTTGASVIGFELPDVHGKITSLDEILSRGFVVLAFFKKSCPVCQLTLPFLERLHLESKTQVCGISQDDPAPTMNFAQTFHLTFPMLIDSRTEGYKVSNVFGITTVPSLFLVEKDHTISWSSESFSKKDLEALGHKLTFSIFRIGDRVPEFKPGSESKN